MTTPLEGVRVVDLSRVLAGPFCSQALADLGATVIKVEHPDGGDDTRRFGPPFLEGESTYYLSINRGKRSIALDFKHPQGREVLDKMLASADVLLENFRPGTLDKVGLGAAACAERFPRLVYASISAYGHDGLPEYSRQPGYDLMAQGLGGIPSLTGPVDGGPSKVGASIADVVSGMLTTQGILAALLQRERTGRGPRVDISMLDGQVALLTYLAAATLNTGKTPRRAGNRHMSIAPYSTYAAADGWLNIAVASEGLWKKFTLAMDCPEWASDPRFASNSARVQNITALEDALCPRLQEHPVATWLTRFEAAGIPAGPVLTLDQTLAHPQLAARDMVLDLPHPRLGSVRLTGNPVRIDDGFVARAAPPTLGEHTDEILNEFGYSAEDIAGLRACGAIA
jgi:crotonobetainyl-CoA:carnitine CoA-transferase CaiB-like acyl-CoA transferase